MIKTTVPAAAVITRVKIERDRKTGMFVLRSQELGRMALAVTSAVLRKIAAWQAWVIVKAWA